MTTPSLAMLTLLVVLSATLVAAVSDTPVLLRWKSEILPTHLEFKLHADHPRMTRHFFDLGVGINKNDSSRSDLAGENDALVRPHLPAGTHHEIRLDPKILPDRLSLTHLRLVHGATGSDIALDPQNLTDVMPRNRAG